MAGAGLIDLRRRTPEGVAHARNPPPWLVPGDVVEVEIGGMGSLRDPVIDEPAEAA